MNLPPLQPAPPVSVIIPARDAATFLPAAVASAVGQWSPGPVEVVVAVAPSRDDTNRVARRLADGDPRVKVVSNPVGTAPAGLNTAISAARGEVIVRLDAHAELPAGYVARAVELLRQTGAANVGGRQVPTAEGGFAGAVAAAMASALGSGGARYRVGGPPGEVDTVYLGVFRRNALEQVGGYNETLVRNQDYELNHRLRRAGGQVYFHPDLAVRYRPRPTVRGVFRQYLEYGAWKRHVMLRQPSSTRPRQLAAPALVVALATSLAAWALSGQAWPFLTVAGGYLLLVVAGALAAAPRPGDAPAVALALVTMHLAWGIGFLAGRRAGQATSRRVTMK